MKVLFAVWELPPFFKVGGLGDVARALPGDLIQMGVDIAVILPFYNKAVIEAIKTNSLGFSPEIIHCNDLHTGLIPLLVKENQMPIKTMLTIHNLAHQGKVTKEVLSKVGVDAEKGSYLAWEKESKQLNLLMEAIIHSDVVTTVS